MVENVSNKTTISLKEKLFIIIFEADTPAGKAFDVGLLIAILFSLFAVMLESVENINSEYGALLRSVEWVFTILFTIEYFLRVLIIDKSWRYIFSFLGLIDLLSIVPTYLSIIVTGGQSLLVIRTIRLMRVFRIFKLARYMGEANVLLIALKASRPKIIVFLGGVLTIAMIMGTIMYLVEGHGAGFDSIPRSIYWAIVTLTTVGYGDIVPTTVIGQIIATAIMIMGYGIIAVPTGIVSVELAQAQKKKFSTIACHSCSREGHDENATFCKYCGVRLHQKKGNS